MNKGGSILMTGSVTGLLGNKRLLDYSLTKGGIHAFACSLATQLGDRGSRVNVVAPGPVWTPLNPADKPAKAVEKFGADTPMRRPAQPEEIAPAFVFLAAPSCASYITGEVLPIIGGYSGGRASRRCGFFSPTTTASRLRALACWRRSRPISPMTSGWSRRRRTTSSPRTR